MEILEVNKVVIFIELTENIEKIEKIDEEEQKKEEIHIAEELYMKIDLADKIEFLIMIMSKNCLDEEIASSVMKNKKKKGWKLLIED
jgi:outer membrane protein assembly factor BamD (BamD/ComL family)